MSSARAKSERAARDALNYLREGNCEQALRAVAHSAFAAGEANAHAESGGFGKQAFSIMEHAGDRVAKSCIRK